jgi:uncharacterized protein (DUF305 family)
MTTLARQFTFLLLLIPSVVAPAQRPGGPLSQTEKGRSEPYWSELKESMDTMHAAASEADVTGDSDLDFARLMLAHHQAAVEMAKTELKYGKEPQMRRLAQEIITDQQSEIELMRLWLKQRDPHSPRKVR